jgi:hypothetical protein
VLECAYPMALQIAAQPFEAALSLMEWRAGAPVAAGIPSTTTYRLVKVSSASVKGMSIGDAPPLADERWCEEGAEMNPESKPAAEASMGELMTQLSSQTSRLVRDEMRSAQQEFVESAKHAGTGAGLINRLDGSRKRGGARLVPRWLADFRRAA